MMTAWEPAQGPAGTSQQSAEETHHRAHHFMMGAGGPLVYSSFSLMYKIVFLCVCVLFGFMVISVGKGGCVF